MNEINVFGVSLKSFDTLSSLISSQVNHDFGAITECPCAKLYDPNHKQANTEIDR